MITIEDVKFEPVCGRIPITANQICHRSKAKRLPISLKEEEEEEEEEEQDEE